MKNDSVINRKATEFALRIIKAYQFLTTEKNEYVMSKQLLRSGTAIGALIREAEFAESKKRFRPQTAHRVERGQRNGLLAPAVVGIQLHRKNGVRFHPVGLYRTHQTAGQYHQNRQIQFINASGRRF